MADEPTLELPLETRCRIVCKAGANTRLWELVNRKGITLYSAPDLWGALEEAFTRGYVEAMLEVNAKLYLLAMTEVE